MGRFVAANHTVAAHNHKKATFKRIDPADIFQNNLSDNDIILAIKPTISSKPINNEITISPTLESINPLPVIGTYSCNSFKVPPTVALCAIRIAHDPTIARATLNSSSAVPAVIFLSDQGIKNLIISVIRAKAFAINITKNIVTLNIVIHLAFHAPIMPSKKS